MVDKMSIVVYYTNSYPSTNLKGVVMSTYVHPALLWITGGFVIFLLSFRLTMRLGPAAARDRSFFTVLSVYCTLTGGAMALMLYVVWTGAVERGIAGIGSVFVGLWLILSIRYLVLNLRQWGQPLSEKELQHVIAGAIVGSVSFGS